MSWYRELERVPNSSATRCAGPGRRRARAPRAAASALKSEVESAARRAPRDHSRCEYSARPRRPEPEAPRQGTSAARLFRYIRYFYLLFQPFFVSTGPSGTRGGAAARPRARASYSEQFDCSNSLLQLPARPGRLHSRVVRRARIRLGPARGRARSPHPAAAAQLHASPVQPRVRRATSRFSVGNSQG